MTSLTTNKRSIMTLYSGIKDPYSHRVRIVLSEKGVTFDVIDVDTSLKAKESLLELNPYGIPPTLIDRDLVLYKSEIIMEYLDERFPHPPLMPVYPVAKARSRLMIYRINKDWYSLMNTILSIQSTFVAKENARKELKESIISIAPIFSELPYFMNEEFSLIDCCIAPLLWRLPILGIELPNNAKPVIEYANRLFERESFQTSLSDVESSMRK